MLRKLKKLFLVLITLSVISCVRSTAENKACLHFLIISHNCLEVDEEEKKGFDTQITCKEINEHNLKMEKLNCVK